MFKGKYVATVTINFDIPDDGSNDRPSDLKNNSAIKAAMENDFADVIKQIIDEEIDMPYMQTKVEKQSFEVQEE